jgi:hypothetical protein
MNTNTIESGTLVRHAPSGEVGRIGNRGARGVWLGDVNGYGHYVYASDCTPLAGAELAAAQERFATK